MSEPDQLLVTKNLSKNFGKIKALRDINFILPRGITALIGPNGAGKSTLLKLILGLIKPSSGSIKILNLDSWDQSAQIHEFIGVVHEKHALVDDLTVNRYLDIVNYFFNPNKAVDLSNILNFSLDRQIKTLSAGMFRRLCLYLCFLGNPKLVIMDETTSSLLFC